MAVDRDPSDTTNARGTLSRQLLALVIGCTLLLSLPISLVNLWISYRQEAALQETQVDAVMSLFGPQLRQAVWDFDEPGVQRLLSGLHHFPALHSLEVVAPDLHATYTKKGSRADQAGPARSYPLVAPEGDMRIGELRLRLDAHALNARIWQGAAHFVAILGVELLALALLIFWSLKRRVTEPVLSLSKHVRDMTPERLAEPAPTPINGASNELHELAHGVTRLQAELRSQLAKRDAIAHTLQESEARLRLMADSIPNQLWTARADGTPDYISQRGLDYLGLQATESEAFSWQRIVHADDLTVHLQEWQRSVATGSPYHQDLRLKRADGVYLWHNVMAVAQRDEAGAVIKWFGSNTDITERKRSQEELMQSQKMNAIGHLAGGIAHDFNNQLTVILGYSELLEMQLSDRELKTLASGILLGANRCRDLTKNLLAFSRKQQLQSVPFDVHALIDETISLLSRSLDKRIHIARKLDAANPLLHGDPTQMQNALLNLALNARDAMSGGGTVTFETALVDLSDGASTPRQLSAKQLGLTPGAYLMLSVSDTGVGMSDQVKQHLFEPFFTTKPVGKGTGMGLPSVYGTVNSHHGKIVVHSEVGVGTTFCLYLPSSEGPSQSQVLTRVSAHPARPLRILVVDDEPIVRELLEQSLRADGHKIVQAVDGEEALRIYARDFHAFDLIILDQMMPGLTGLETFHQLRQINPEAKILLASGFSTPGEVETMLALGAQGFLQKPFELRQLRGAVAAAILSHDEEPRSS